MCRRVASEWRVIFVIFHSAKFSCNFQCDFQWNYFSRVASSSSAARLTWEKWFHLSTQRGRRHLMACFTNNSTVGGECLGKLAMNFYSLINFIGCAWFELKSEQEIVNFINGNGNNWNKDWRNYQFEIWNFEWKMSFWSFKSEKVVKHQFYYQWFTIKNWLQSF